MTDKEKIENLVHLINISALDQTIKDILIRDLQSEGLTEFLREQIKAYCLEGLRKIDAQILSAQQILEQKQSSDNNPA